MAPCITFYDWAPSPFCIKVRAILDYKGIEYKRVNPLGMPALEIRRRGKVGKVPAIEIDGELIVDSTDIAYELERQFPDFSVIPTLAADRARCHVLEDWSDESLYFINLYYRWYEPQGRAAVPSAFGKSPVGRFAYLYYQRLILKQLKGQGTLRKTAEHVKSDLSRHLDALESLLGSSVFLLSDRPYLCDFALHGQLVYLARTPVGGPMLEGRKAIARFRSEMKELLTACQSRRAEA